MCDLVKNVASATSQHLLKPLMRLLFTDERFLAH
jgi:hypothetical protein